MKFSEKKEEKIHFIQPAFTIHFLPKLYFFRFASFFNQVTFFSSYVSCLNFPRKSNHAGLHQYEFIYLYDVTMIMMTHFTFCVSFLLDKVQR